MLTLDRLQCLCNTCKFSTILRTEIVVTYMSLFIHKSVDMFPFSLYLLLTPTQHQRSEMKYYTSQSKPGSEPPISVTTDWSGKLMQRGNVEEHLSMSLRAWNNQINQHLSIWSLNSVAANGTRQHFGTDLELAFLIPSSFVVSVVVRVLRTRQIFYNSSIMSFLNLVYTFICVLRYCHG